MERSGSVEGERSMSWLEKEEQTDVIRLQREKSGSVGGEGRKSSKRDLEDIRRI